MQMTFQNGNGFSGEQGMIRDRRAVVLQHHPGDLTFEDQFAVDQPLGEADESARPERLLLRDHIELVAGHDLAAKDKLVAAGEADESVLPGFLVVEDAAELGDGFDLKDARKEGPARNMAGNPEFIFAHFLHAEGDGARLIDPDHVIEMAHIPRLRIDAADFIGRDGDPGEVELIEIEQGLAGHAVLRPNESWNDRQRMIHQGSSVRGGQDTGWARNHHFRVPGVIPGRPAPPR